MLNLLKSTRVIRSLIPLSFIMIIVGFADKITREVYILGICCILIYSVGGILNAGIDRDYKLKHSSKIIVLLLITALILSLSNLIIFLTVLTWILLGFVYNIISRFVLFGDIIILSLTHSVLPIVSSILLLNLNLNLTLILFIFISTCLVIPMKNLKGIKKDKEKDYKTLMTKFKNGKKITYFLLELYFISLFIAYFIFDLGTKFLSILLIIFILRIFMIYFLNHKKEILSYKLTRLVALLFSLAFVYDKVTNINLVFISLFLILIYLFYLIFFLELNSSPIIKEVNNGVL